MLKRDEVKYIRDLAKSSYTKDSECYICGSKDNLQLHHFYSISALWNKYKKGIVIKSVEDINKYRESFIEEHKKELYEEVVTLCKECHMNKLHKIYGVSPSLGTAKKQKRWVEIQREKNGN